MSKIVVTTYPKGGGQPTSTEAEGVMDAIHLALKADHDPTVGVWGITEFHKDGTGTSLVNSWDGEQIDGVLAPAIR